MIFSMEEQIQKYAIIGAGGKGLRMGTFIPKQFLLLEGRPVLMLTMDAFYNYDPEIRLILVLPEDQQDFWEDLCRLHKFSIPYRMVLGGPTRFDSVKNGLAEVGDSGLVAIHDGVRPLVSPLLLSRCYEAAAIFGAVVPVTGVLESIRKVDGDSSQAVSREDFWLVQTPQVFKAEVILNAYNMAEGNDFTDDATVVESFGNNIRLVEGTRENIKITTPVDLLFAEAYIKSKK
jgi:2-C-methyl-D-erythritol 4-phosphate cytidylyltransferase